MSTSPGSRRTPRSRRGHPYAARLYKYRRDQRMVVKRGQDGVRCWSLSCNDSLLPEGEGGKMIERAAVSNFKRRTIMSYCDLNPGTYCKIMSWAKYETSALRELNRSVLVQTVFSWPQQPCMATCLSRCASIQTRSDKTKHCRCTKIDSLVG